ncbi:2Fe-2S iron-sulfur cluster-binding protein [Denitromonas iodatirespirans]|uniref:2Fe-2S iron-sulfur cluster binding domain-containing protein n=1 Tax=Denitromonas iodatirespirans TaxID=2795389 RepID=A0A944DGR5_DENI1|nr:2Fe-2S iron-sulfur cluster-binding protein [Denitromonas iodatirespirans]MBT0964018.1 2Fe-2S iron-sulfur cluster binding domain-containing protein [Denitromonas iodatirespirans]
MVMITYIEPNGSEQQIDVPEGWSLMQAALSNGVEGIEGECGGSCACATCHCYVDDTWAERLPAAADNELEMLDNVAAERRPTSRLSCQIKASADLAGMVVRLPDVQS